MNDEQRKEIRQQFWDEDYFDGLPNRGELLKHFINEYGKAIERQLQKERDLLFSAHSYEMVRADELQIEVDRLTMLVETTTTECNRLYRVIELNGKLA